MRSETEIKERLRELHGETLAKEMGGFKEYSQAIELLWVLGYNNPRPRADNDGIYPGEVDVSDYIDV